MKEELAVELLKIAAQVATAAIEKNTTTASSRAGQAIKADDLFSDISKAVHAQFDALTGTTK